MDTAIRESSWHTFCCLDNIQPPQKQHEAPQATSTVGQMAEALRACRLWAKEPSRESSYSDVLPALKFPQLKIGAKENLQAVQHEMCLAQRWKTEIKTIKPVTLSKQIGNSHKLLLDINWRFLLKIDANCIFSLFHQVNYSWCFQALNICLKWSQT